ncbi:MAG: hypothetical protein ACOC59_01930, partial [Bacteroidota bacterium]
MKKWFYCFLSVVILAGLLGESYASPSITGVSGSIVDRSSIVIGGSSFGSNSLDIEWTGDNIEAGAVGDNFSKKKWAVDGTVGSTAFYPTKYTDTKVHSGSQSLISQYPEESYYGSGYQYDHGSVFGTIYASWWVYFDHVDSQGQWKKWRLSPGVGWNRYEGEIEQGDFYEASGECRQALVNLFCNAGPYDECFPDSNYGNRWTDCTPNNAWRRIELYAKESSEAGARDGVFIYMVHPQSGLVETRKDWDGTVITRAEGVTERWRYMKFQNYWGNISGGDGTKEKIYVDDIFIQIGSQARVEIGDNATWTHCTHREIQIPTAWSDTEIT